MEPALNAHRDPLTLPPILLVLTDDLNRAIESGSLRAQFCALDEIFHTLIAFGISGDVPNMPVIEMALCAQRQSFRVWMALVLERKIKNLKNELITPSDITPVSTAIIPVSRLREGQTSSAETQRLFQSLHNDNVCLLGCRQSSKRLDTGPPRGRDDMTGLMMKTLCQIFGYSSIEGRPRLKDGPAFQGKYTVPREILKSAAAQVATTTEYVDWLEGHLRAGGNIGGVSTANTQTGHHIHIARRNFDLQPIPSTSALKLIVPELIKVKLTDPFYEHGENHLYRMDGYKKEGLSGTSPTITVYADTLEEMRTRDLFAPIISKLDEAMALVPEKVDLDALATVAEAREAIAKRDQNLPERNQLIFDINAIVEAQLRGQVAVKPVVPHTVPQPA